MSAANMSPSSPSNEPRLPSPPPYTESQIGPRTNAEAAENRESADVAPRVHDAGLRIRPGTKAADMAAAHAPLRALNEVNQIYPPI